MQRARRSVATVAAGIAAACLTLAMGALPAAADDYDPQRAGHPFRVAVYLIHPVGVALDLLIFRPAHWLGSHEPLASLFGHEPYTD